MMLNTLRDCLNVINKEFELSLGREVILALWNKRHLRKFSPKELQGLYSTVIEELIYVKDKEVRKNLLKLRLTLKPRVCSAQQCFLRVVAAELAVAVGDRVVHLV